MNRFICIHGHFYQPPRENPWLGEIELQDSAYPYHDWNDRITAECYAPNTASRILDDERKIIAIVNNYSKMSFNFGPTLLSWMERHRPDIYEAILEADKESMKNFSGHGSAIAQVYNHMIMPLSNARDRRTQVLWGIKDFEHRFGRRPAGMWLAETAVDTETLEVLAQQGIKFTILAPNQAKEVKDPLEEEWRDVSGSKIDPRRPYKCVMPSGREIALFFYDGPISRELGFGDLLNSGEKFADRLVSVFSEKGTEPELVHVATDGETYGHHHPHGDMALAYCVHNIESNKRAGITIYAEYLEKFPPEWEARIYDESSWSCVHGVERWKSDCGCNSGMKQGWNQKWREPLRNSLDWLRDSTAPVYERKMSELLSDPWKARDEYVDVILKRSKESVDDFLKKHAGRELSEGEKITAVKLLEMEHHAMLMYTSCGWFFDEISGIETTQVLQYAARVMQLCREVSGFDPEPEFLAALSAASSNIPKYGDGAKVFSMFVRPAIIDLLRVGVHYAVSSVFEDYPEKAGIYCYTVETQGYDRLDAGKQRFGIGKAKMRSNITMEENFISFAVLHMGDHNLIAGVRESAGDADFKKMREELKSAFSKGEAQEVIGLIHSHFKENNFSLWHLFKDEQQKILNQVFDSIFENTKALYRQIYENNYQIMQVMKEKGIYLPKAFLSAVEFVLNMELKGLMENMEPQPLELKRIVDEAGKWEIDLDKKILKTAVADELGDIMGMLFQEPENIEIFEKIRDTLKILNDFDAGLNLWKAQNAYFRLGEKMAASMKKKAERKDTTAEKWLEYFYDTGSCLGVKF